MRAMKQAFSLSYSERMKKISSALEQTGKFYDFYIQDAGDDFAIVSVWDRGYDCKLFRFVLSWNGEEPVIGDSQEVRLAYVPLDQEIVFKSDKDELEKENIRLKAELEVLKKQPAAKSAHEEFQDGGEVKKTGNKGLDRLAQYMNA